MRGSFGLKLQNSPKLPRMHARFYCNANEKSKPWKGLLLKLENLLRWSFFTFIITFSFVPLEILIACSWDYKLKDFNINVFCDRKTDLLKELLSLSHSSLISNPIPYFILTLFSISLKRKLCIPHRFFVECIRRFLFGGRSLLIVIKQMWHWSTFPFQY